MNPQSTNPNPNHNVQRILQTINTNIIKISQNVGQIEGLVQHIGTSMDSENLREKLLQVENYTNQLAKDTNKQLKELNSYTRDDRSLKLQKERITNDLFKALNRFQEAQKQSMQRQKESNERAKAYLAFQQNDTHFEMMENQDVKIDDQAITYGQARDQKITMEMDVNLVQLQEREAALRKLENDIGDVNTIFKDLAVMVHDQGEVIDSIESNVETVKITVQNANSNLQSAAKYQSNARKKKVIFASILLVVLAIIILIIVLSVKTYI